MGLKRLTIKNIGSITSKTIDFEAEPLKSASLFLISGPTGSGKSIILDCICLALYGKAARLVKTRSNDKYYDTSFNCSQDGSISLDDPRQLVRRGTVNALAELVFTGIDGVEYTASWSVSRGERAKLDQRLSTEKRKITSADGSVCFTKIAEVDKFIQSPRVIGMKFDEFCRTCILTQGEFTKFIDSKTEDKASILEKLTGTEKFSIIGTRINENYKKIKDQYDDLTADIDDPQKKPMPEEERTALEKERKDKTEEKIRFNELKGHLSSKKNILDRQTALEEKERNSIERFDQAKAEQTSEAYKKDRKTSSDWKASADARADLKKKAKAELDKVAATKTMSGYTGTFGILCGNLLWLKDSLAAYKDIDADINAKQAEINGKEAEKAALHPENLAAEGIILSEAKAAIDQILRQASLWKTSRKNTIPEKDIQKYNPLQKKLYDDALADAKQLWDAEDRQAEAQGIYDEVLKRYKDHAEVVRSSLKVGDICPACGNIVKEIFSNEKIIEILQPYKDDITKRQNNVDTAKENYDKTLEVISNASGMAGNAITEWQTRSGKVTEIANAITKLVRELGELKAKLTEKERIEETIARIGNIKSDVMKKLKVSEPEAVISKENKSLESGWNSLRDNINSTQNELTAAEKSIQETSDSVEKFLKGNPLFTAEILAELSLKSQKDIDVLEQRTQSIDAAVIAANALIEGCKNERLALEKEIKTGGYTFEEEETSDTLKEAIAELEQSISDIDTRCGEINTAIDIDNDKTKARADAEKALNAIQAEKTNYEILNSLFGQSNGSLFKRIAQSHLLGVLLENANYYMRRFDERYELTRQQGSLVVLISDKQQDGIPRPVNTLSNGEGFMASLALALGLSSLSRSNLALDTIFIDEGFGSLSPAPLANVYNTLSSLKQEEGKKVGIISHIIELKDQIHPQMLIEPVGNGESVIHDPE